MPDDFYRPLCKGRFIYPEIKQLCKEIFNDENQYEDALFRVEDDIYKVDFEIGNIYKTMKVLEEEKDRISTMANAEKDFKIDEKKLNKLRLK